MGSFVARGNQYIQLVKVLYCKPLTISKHLTNFPTNSPGFELLTLEVEGGCFTTVPL